MRVDDRLLVGSGPEADAGAFAALQSMGVTVVLSVDGRAPDVAAARRHGMRTIHLPLGYDGVPHERLRSLARVADEVKGTIYVHCHRGIHRGPAAAAILWMLRTDGAPGNARELLVRAGTSEAYGGLWRAVETFKPPSGGFSDAPIPESQSPAGITELMIGIENARLNIDKAGPGHPDIDTDHELLMVREYLVELGRLHPDGVAGEKAGWHAHLGATIEAVDALAGGMTPAGLTRLDAACNACHASLRD